MAFYSQYGIGSSNKWLSSPICTQIRSLLLILAFQLSYVHCQDYVSTDYVSTETELETVSEEMIALLHFLAKQQPRASGTENIPQRWMELCHL